MIMKGVPHLRKLSIVQNCKAKAFLLSPDNLVSPLQAGEETGEAPSGSLGTPKKNMSNTPPYGHNMSQSYFCFSPYFLVPLTFFLSCSKWTGDGINYLVWRPKMRMPWNRVKTIRQLFKKSKMFLRGWASICQLFWGSQRGHQKKIAHALHPKFGCDSTNTICVAWYGWKWGTPQKDGLPIVIWQKWFRSHSHMMKSGPPQLNFTLRPEMTWWVLKDIMIAP